MRTLLRAIVVALVLPGPAALHSQATGQSVLSQSATPAGARSTIVVLVRHAEKAAEPANDPPLTPAGAARAQALARALADARVDVVIATPTRRTRETAAPAAALWSLAPEEMSPAGGVPAHAAAVAERIRAAHAGKRVLVVGHSNTIPAIIRALGGPAMPDLCDAQYASLFVLEVPATGTAALIRSTFGAPDAADAGACGQMKP